MFFSWLCSLMREGRVGHIEELLKCNAFWTRNKLQEVGHRARSHQEAHIFSKLLEMFRISYANIRLLFFKVD